MHARWLPWVLLLALAPALPARAQTIQRVPRPPPLVAPEPECELFRGTGSGNSDAVVELRLCRQPDSTLAGELQWSSTESGWSRRRLSGRWEGDQFLGREEGFVENRPAPGWQFCLIDAYDLTRSGPRLAGSYVSTPCRDRGTFDLTLIPRDEAGATPSPTPIGATGPAPAPPASSAAPPGSREDRGLFSCRAAPGRPAPRLALLAPLAALLLVWRSVKPR